MTPTQPGHRKEPAGRARRRAAVIGVLAGAFGAAGIIWSLFAFAASADATPDPAPASTRRVKALSDSVAIFKIGLTSATNEDLVKVTVKFTSVSGFTTGDLLSGAGAEIWRDTSRSGANEDVLDAGDVDVTSAFAFQAGDSCDPDCIAEVDVDTALPEAEIPAAEEGAAEFFLAIRTSDAITHGDQFTATLDITAFTTALQDGTPTTTAMTAAVTTGTIEADRQAPAAPSVGALGVSRAAGIVRVLGTAVSVENPGVLEIRTKSGGDVCSGPTLLARSALQDLGVTNADLITGISAAELPAGTLVCYRVLDEAGNASPYAADGQIPAQPTTGDVALLGVSNVSAPNLDADGRKRVYAAQDTSVRTFRLYLRPGGSGLVRAESEAATPTSVDVTTSTSGPADSGTHNIRQFGGGATLAAGDGVAFTLVSDAGNEGEVRDAGTIPAAPIQGDIDLLGTSAATGHQRVAAAADASPGRTFGLHMDVDGTDNFRRAVTASGGATPVRVTTAATATDSGTTTIFSGAAGTTPVAAGHEVGYTAVDADGNESDVTADGLIPVAPVAADIEASDALDTFTVDPHPDPGGAERVRQFAGATAGSAYGAGSRGEALDATPVGVADHPDGDGLFYTTYDTGTDNESPTTADGTVPNPPASPSDVDLLATSAAGSNQKVTAATDGDAPRTFRLYVDTAGGTAYTRAVTASGGTTPVEVTTSNAGATDSGTTEIYAGAGGTTQLAGGHTVGFALLDGDGNDSDVTADGAIPAAPAAGTTSASAALNTVTATSASAALNVLAFIDISNDPAVAYAGGVDVTLDDTQTKTVPSPGLQVNDFLHYTAKDTASGNESPIASDGSIPAAPTATQIGLLGTSAADGHQRIIAQADGGEAGNTFSLFIDTGDGAGFSRAFTSQSGSTGAEVTVDAGAVAESCTGSSCELWAGAKGASRPSRVQLAAAHTVGYVVTASGNDSPVTGDGTIPAAPIAGDLSLTDAVDEVSIAAFPLDADEVHLYVGAAGDAAADAYDGTPDETITGTAPQATADFGAASPLYYTAKDTTTGNESPTTADGTIPAPVSASVASASDARDELAFAGFGFGGLEINVFTDGSTSSGETAWQNAGGAPDCRASQSPTGYATGDVSCTGGTTDLPQAEFVFYSVTDTASGNESEMTADGIIPAPAGIAPGLTAASAAAQTFSVEATATQRTLRLYGRPGNTGAWVRATTTSGGTAPVEVTTDPDVQVTSGAGIFLGGTALDAGDGVAYATVEDGNDSDLDLDGLIPSAPGNAALFGANAGTGEWTLDAAAATGTYRLFADGTPEDGGHNHTAGTSSTFSLVPPLVLAEGDAIGYAARCTDHAGCVDTDTDGDSTLDAASQNESPLLADGVIPPTAAPDLQAASDTAGPDGSATDNVTSKDGADLVFDVATDAGATATLLDGATVLATVTDGGAGDADGTANGVVSLAPDAPLGEGTFASIAARTSNAAGNTSTTSAALAPALVIDQTAPAAPATPDMQDADDPDGDDETTSTTPTFDVAGAEVDATVTLVIDGVDDTSVLAAATTVAIQASGLGDGTYDIAARQTDAAGNASTTSATLPITVDAGVPPAPAKPDLVAASDTGNTSDDLTTDNTPTFLVDGVASGNTVVLFANGAEIGSGTASSSVTITPDDPLADGSYTIRAKAVDSNGDESPLSQALEITIRAAQVRFDRSSYTFKQTVRPEVEDAEANADAGVAETVTVTLSSGSGSVTAVLTETGAGTSVFRGTATLSARSNSDAADRLKAAEGATIAGHYTETVPGGSTRTRTGSATVATVFVDDDGNTHEPSIITIWKHGITLGCGGSNYCPGGDVTRGEMASFLVKALGLAPAPPGVDYFVDDDGTTHEKNINTLRHHGITTGCGGDNYCPNDPVTRGQMATFLVKGYGIAASSVDAFGDDDGTTHEDDINALAASGITGGCAPGQYCPFDFVTRAEMATFLTKAPDPDLV